MKCHTTYTAKQREKNFSYLLQRQRVINRSYIGYKVDRLPTWFSDKESTCQVGDEGLILGSGRSPWRRKWQPTPVLLPAKSHGQRNLASYSLWGHKRLDRTQQLNNSNKVDARGVHSSTGLEAFNLKKCFCYKPEAWSCLAPGDIYLHFTMLE